MATRLLLFLLLISSALGANEKKVVAYYTNWSTYHPYYSLYVRDIPFDLIDVLIYAFVNVDEKGTLSLSDPAVDTDNFVDLARFKGETKVLFSVGGWGKGSLPFARLAADIEARRHFAQQTVEFCKRYDLDGIDVDWEFPRNLDEGKNLVLLLTDLFLALKQHKLLVTAALPGTPAHYNNIPLAACRYSVDQFHIMTYNFHGPWGGGEDPVTNHQCALKQTVIGNPILNIRSTMEHYEKYLPKEKLFIGLPFFFNTYLCATRGILPSHYGSPYTGPAPNPYSSYTDGTLLYRHVMNSLKRGEAKGFWDPISVAYTVFYPEGQIFGSGICTQSIENVCDFLFEKDFQGIMTWELRGDTPTWEALKAIRSGLSGANKSD